MIKKILSIILIYSSILSQSIIDINQIMLDIISAEQYLIPAESHYAQTFFFDVTGANADNNSFPSPPLDYANLSESRKFLLDKIDRQHGNGPIDGLGVRQITGRFGTNWHDGRWCSDNVLLDEKGPAAIVLFWNTIIPRNWYNSAAERAAYIEKRYYSKNTPEAFRKVYNLEELKKLALREPMLKFYFDGEEKASLEFSLKDLAEGKVELFAGISGKTACQDIALYNAVPIPFNKSLKVVLINKPPVFYYQFKLRRYSKNISIKTFDKKYDKNIYSQYKKCFASGTLIYPDVYVTNDFVKIKSGKIFADNNRGIIHSIKLVTDNFTLIAENDELRLQIYWDKEVIPSIDAPLWMLFGISKKECADFSSFFLSKKENEYTLKILMPYEQADFEMTGVNKKEFKNSSLIIEYENAPEKQYTARFKAEYNNKIFAKPQGRGWGFSYENKGEYNENHLIITNLQAEGRFIGSIIWLYSTLDLVWEGDEIGWIDDKKIPSIFGTGLEDYFMGSWYNFPQPSAAWGQLLRNKEPYNEFDAAIWGGEPWDKKMNTIFVYRFHIPDNIYFEKSFIFGIERGSANTEAAHCRSLGFYYTYK